MENNDLKEHENQKCAWTGPYKVTACTPKGHVKMKNLTCGKLLKDTIQQTSKSSSYISLQVLPPSPPPLPVTTLCSYPAVPYKLEAFFWIYYSQISDKALPNSEPISAPVCTSVATSLGTMHTPAYFDRSLLNKEEQSRPKVMTTVIFALTTNYEGPRSNT